MSFRILISAGGTGGHVYPALALGRELQDRYGCQIRFAAGKLSSNPYFNKSFSFQDISCSSRLIKGSWTNVKGVIDSIKVIKKFNPDAIVGFGSYFTLPVLIASKILQKPLFLHDGNSIPGKVNRLFSPFAKKSWVFFPEAKKRLSGLVEECKMPLRAQFKKDLVSKESACAYFELNPRLPVILVFGGSQGAMAINDLFSDLTLKELNRRLPIFQVIHFTGAKENLEILTSRYLANQIKAIVKPYENRMDLAWAAADMAISRAGAGSIAEQFEYKVPGLWIPFPGATDGHQELNAKKMVDIGLGVQISESQLSQTVFVDAVQHLFENREKKYLNFKPSDFDLSDRIMDWLRGSP